MQKEKSLSRDKDVNKRGVIYEKPSGACLTAGGGDLILHYDDIPRTNVTVLNYENSASFIVILI